MALRATGVSLVNSKPTLVPPFPFRDASWPVHACLLCHTNMCMVRYKLGIGLQGLLGIGLQGLVIF